LVLELRGVLCETHLTNYDSQENENQKRFADMGVSDDHKLLF